MPTPEAESPESLSKPTEVIADDPVADEGAGSRVPEPGIDRFGSEEGRAKDRGASATVPAVRTYAPEEAIVRRTGPGVRFVDVREAREVAEGIVPGAVHVPLDRVELAIDPDSPHCNAAIDDAAEIVFYCRSGRRSAVAAQRAIEMGVDHVAHVEGGIRAWATVGGPVQAVRAPDRP